MELLKKEENNEVTLDKFITEHKNEFSSNPIELSCILQDIGMAGKIVSAKINRAGLADILGDYGKKNVHDEDVKKLDIIANELFIDTLKKKGVCCGIASEEDEDIVIFNDVNAKKGQYVVLFDPLDGSSNIDVNVSVGTIFSVYKRVTKGYPCSLQDFLQPGTEQVMAGYIIYGSSTMLVYSSGNGVNGFTLDPALEEYCLSHPDIKTPSSGKIYSVNQGNFTDFPEGVQRYINCCLDKDEANNRPYTLRYIGSMVADFHRNLLKGGIFIYPASKKAPNGKLRLLYECNPLSFLVEQAGGTSTNGFKRILELQPNELHQRTPIFIGSKEMVKEAGGFMLKYSEKKTL